MPKSRPSAQLAHALGRVIPEIAVGQLDVIGHRAVAQAGPVRRPAAATNCSRLLNAPVPAFEDLDLVPLDVNSVDRRLTWP
jgi:hypothetical protein